MVDRRRTQMAVNRMVGPGTPKPAAAAGISMTPKDILAIFRRHTLLIISFTIVGFFVGGVAWYLLLKYRPMYTAQSYIKVLSPVDKDPTTIGGVVLNKDIAYGHRMLMATLMKQQRMFEDLLKRDKIQETEWFKSFGQIKSKRLLNAVQDLKKRLGVNAQRDGDFISISMTCRSKKESALIVNEMMDLFVSSQGSSRGRDLDAKLTSLQTELIRLLRDMDSADRALDEVRNTSGFSDLEKISFEDAVTKKVGDLEFEQSQLILQIQQIRTAIGTYEGHATGPFNVQTEQDIERDPIVLNLSQQILLMESSLSGRLTRLGENHQTVRQTQRTINETRAKMQERKVLVGERARNANLKNAKDQLVMLTDGLEELEKLQEEAAAEKKELDAARILYARRLDTRDERKLRLEETKSQIEKYRVIREDPEMPKVQRLGYAPEPLEISSPKWKIYFPAGTMLGLLSGIGIAFLIEILNDLVRTPRDVAQYLHIALLGVIPDADEDDQAEGIELSQIVSAAPYSIVSESYRKFRTNLRLSDAGESSKVLLVSSGRAGEGKTSVASNLAIALLAENNKVLLIDANFWQPNLHKIFPQAQAEAQDDAAGTSEFGLSTLLSGLCGYNEVIRHSGLDGLDIIDTGPLPANPAELLSSILVQQLIKHQRQNYDYVIIDGPPVLLLSDAKVLGRLVDGTVLVFNANTTRRGTALRTIRELNQVHANIVGGVLFAAKSLKGGYFDEQFKSYQKYQKLQLAQTSG